MDKQEEKQTFQSEWRLMMLEVHDVWTGLENIVFFPFRWLAEQMTNTHLFREENARPSLTVVK